MLPQRKHIRLRGFDYSSVNNYFITTCVKNMMPLLGGIKNGICGLSDMGSDVAFRLQNIPLLYPHVVLDEFIVMPNHFHVILIIGKQEGPWKESGFQKPVAGSVSTIINAAKGATTKRCKANGDYHFDWQDKFHDHVIRNEAEYRAIKKYIINNPCNWINDRFFV